MSKEKKKRNEKIYSLWKKEVGVRPLARQFNKVPSTIHAIVHRMKEKEEAENKGRS